MIKLHHQKAKVNFILAGQNHITLKQKAPGLIPRALFSQ